MKIEIVSHCWQYPRLLNFQLSSLVLYPPQQVDVVMTVFVTREDTESVRVVEFFAGQMRSHTSIRPWFLSKDELLRRQIGRNRAALATEADWVWFADCDYLFGRGALDALGSALRSVEGPLAFPRHVRVHKDHSFGDTAIAQLDSVPCISDVEPSEFVRMRNDRAIGGIQIARAAVVRERGYLKDQPPPQKPALAWQRTSSDVLFRHDLGTRGRSIKVPNIFRIRHSVAGQRDGDVKL